jgi:hypothetical protein
MVGSGAAHNTTDMGGANVAHKSTNRGKIVDAAAIIMELTVVMMTQTPKGVGIVGTTMWEYRINTICLL